MAKSFQELMMESNGERDRILAAVTRTGNIVFLNKDPNKNGGVNFVSGFKQAYKMTYNDARLKKEELEKNHGALKNITILFTGIAHQ